MGAVARLGWIEWRGRAGIERMERQHRLEIKRMETESRAREAEMDVELERVRMPWSSEGMVLMYSSLRRGQDGLSGGFEERYLNLENHVPQRRPGPALFLKLIKKCTSYDSQVVTKACDVVILCKVYAIQSQELMR